MHFVAAKTLTYTVKNDKVDSWCGWKRSYRCKDCDLCYSTSNADSLKYVIKNMQYTEPSWLHLQEFSIPVMKHFKSRRSHKT